MQYIIKLGNLYLDHAGEFSSEQSNAKRFTLDTARDLRVVKIVPKHSACPGCASSNLDLTEHDYSPF